MVVRKAQASQFPELPFAQRRAVRFDDAARLSGRLTGDSATKIEYWPTKSGDTFQFSFSAVVSERLRIVSSASTPMRFSSSDSPYGIVLLPVHGQSIATRDRKSIEWGEGRNAVYLPPGTTSGESGLRSVAGVDIDPERLGRMADVMLGEHSDRNRGLNLETFRPLDLSFGEVQFQRVFEHYMTLLNAMDSDADRIEKSGLSDMILRSTIMLLVPHMFFSVERKPVTASQVRIARICEYIDANLTTKITLTDLERLSGLSARNLQYTFRSLMGHSPMQWVTERRLQAVRDNLLAARPGASLSAIASIYFTNLGDFARYYRKRYGELPSETLFRAQRKPFRT
ncbi:helix-turn-helix domain-containing protein (plasmid) [Agrobacterium sp. rho-13.3]|uniref:helix-turn-helix domain-containing protein n=1 Tax=Agrobacterium sp. rho-13.3 TaxID=3072980 RepID=UPI002A16C96B|nr:AraC family transcriptional regulator [Agrobacterium sp. rho-13.3]MDX8310267.1 AraC family transcriptional regulator [Agrobacterium sp. rho-13.3]